MRRLADSYVLLVSFRVHFRLIPLTERVLEWIDWLLAKSIHPSRLQKVAECLQDAITYMDMLVTTQQHAEEPLDAPLRNPLTQELSDVEAMCNKALLSTQSELKILLSLARGDFDSDTFVFVFFLRFPRNALVVWICRSSR